MPSTPKPFINSSTVRGIRYVVRPPIHSDCQLSETLVPSTALSRYWQILEGKRGRSVNRSPMVVALPLPRECPLALPKQCRTHIGRAASTCASKRRLQQWLVRFCAVAAKPVP